MPGNASTAAEQLHRLLLILPALADDQAHPVSEIAARIGAPESVILRDLADLVRRVTDEPAGFTEGVSLLIDGDSVQFQTTSGHFRRPMALTQDELQALELGLAMLAQESPPHEREVLRRARERLQRALPEVMQAADVASSRLASLVDASDAAQAIRRTLQQCIRNRRVVRIAYRSATAVTDGERDIQPLGIVWSRGAWYLVAWCRRSDGLRVFRLDRIASAATTDERFASIDGFSLQDVLRDGRVLVGDDGTQMRVRYSPRIARWIQEREGGELEADGSLIRDVDALQADWAVRHVLRYGPDAELLEPESLRAAVRATLQRTLDASGA